MGYWEKRLGSVMEPFQKIGIIGVGVIGGSLGLAIKRKVPNVHILGVSSQKTIDEALVMGAIDTGFERSKIEECLVQADLVFLCSPISHIISILPIVAKTIKPGTLVTDVGSTKRRIVETADQYFPSDRFFIGGHPMAGNEGTGVKWADSLLFENAVYVITPSRQVPQKPIMEFGQIIEKIGAKIIFLSPAMHDKIASVVSHLPQMIAVTLMNFVSQDSQNVDILHKLAAGGFRDMTRIASSPYDIWADIIHTNKDEIMARIDEFIDLLQITKNNLGKNVLQESFHLAAQNRLSIPRDTKGFLRSQFDLSVRIEDKPGVIATIANALAKENLNIKDIEVLKIREGDSGTLRLSFETKEARQQAHNVLKSISISSRFRD